MTVPPDWSGRGLSTHPSFWLAELDDVVFEVAQLATAAALTRRTGTDVASNDDEPLMCTTFHPSFFSNL